MILKQMSPIVIGGFFFLWKMNNPVQKFQGEAKRQNKGYPNAYSAKSTKSPLVEKRSTLWSRFMISISSRLCPPTQSAFLFPQADLTFGTEADWGVSVHHLISTSRLLRATSNLAIRWGCVRNIFSYFDTLTKKLH